MVVNQMARMLVQGEISDNSTVLISAHPENEAALLIRQKMPAASDVTHTTANVASRL
jgi:hypothetical protein